MGSFRYDGKRALIIGGATGMGAGAAHAVAALGAEVVVMDHAPVEYPVAQSIQVDLRDRSAIDTALAAVDGPVHGLFCAAGVADGTPGLMKVNFISHRHIITSLLASGQLSRGGAVCMISSVAGLGWEAHIPDLLEFLKTPDYESASAWIDAHPGTDTYGFSKQVMNCYVAWQAYPLLVEGVRINAICPGPTDTPLARANADLWLTYAQDYRDATSTTFLSPEQMGDAMAFLNSDAASAVNGLNMVIDNGHFSSSLTGSWEPGHQLISMLMGRS